MLRIAAESNTEPEAKVTGSLLRGCPEKDDPLAGRLFSVP
jgi:hypothetical protein